VLPAPLVTAAPRCPARPPSLPHPATTTRAAASPVHSAPAAPMRRASPGATAPVPCRLRQHHTLAPPSPLLLLPPCGTKPDPPALFLPVVPPSRHTKATPDAIPRFARFPHASTGAPRLLPHFLPLDAPSTHGDREAPDRTRPRWFPPELRRRPPLSVSVT
jgi:hypothetical protein